MAVIGTEAGGLSASEIISIEDRRRTRFYNIRSMCEGGSALALMGNHEFNAVGWARGYKPVKPSHEKARAEFLRQIGDASPGYWSAIEWFETLPIWLDLDGLALVHACWHEPSMTALRPLLSSRNSLTEIGWQEAHHQRSSAYEAAEILLKGPEQELPHDAHFSDKDGNKRRHQRVDWWQEQSDGGPYQLDRPILFGHYWLTDTPRVIGPRASCLDFSVAAGGFLTCYRWSGEETFSAEHLVFVAA
jgi:hypothetical protein